MNVSSGRVVLQDVSLLDELQYSGLSNRYRHGYGVHRHKVGIWALGSP